MSMPRFEVTEAYLKARFDYLQQLNHVLAQKPFKTEITDIAGKVLSQSDAYKLLQQGKDKRWFVTEADAKCAQAIVAKFRLLQTDPALQEWLEGLFVTAGKMAHDESDVLRQLVDYSQRMQTAVKTAQFAPLPTVKHDLPQANGADSSAYSTSIISFSTVCKVAALAVVVGVGYRLACDGFTDFFSLAKPVPNPAKMFAGGDAALKCEPVLRSFDASDDLAGIGPWAYDYRKPPVVADIKLASAAWQSGQYIGKTQRRAETASYEGHAAQVADLAKGKMPAILPEQSNFTKIDVDVLARAEANVTDVISPLNPGGAAFVEAVMPHLPHAQPEISPSGQKALREWLLAIYHNSSPQDIGLFVAGLAATTANMAQGLRGKGVPKDKFVCSLLPIGCVVGAVFGAYHNLLDYETLGAHASGALPLDSFSRGVHAVKDIELMAPMLVIPTAVALGAMWVKNTEELEPLNSGIGALSGLASKNAVTWSISRLNQGGNFQLSGPMLLQTAAGSAYYRTFKYLQEAGCDNFSLGWAWGVTPFLAAANGVYMYHVAANNSLAAVAAGAGVGAVVNLGFTYHRALATGAGKTLEAVKGLSQGAAAIGVKGLVKPSLVVVNGIAQLAQTSRSALVNGVSGAFSYAKEYLHPDSQKDAHYRLVQKILNRK